MMMIDNCRLSPSLGLPVRVENLTRAPAGNTTFETDDSFITNNWMLNKVSTFHFRSFFIEGLALVCWVLYRLTGEVVRSFLTQRLDETSERIIVGETKRRRRDVGRKMSSKTVGTSRLCQNVLGLDVYVTDFRDLCPDAETPETRSLVRDVGWRCWSIFELCQSWRLKTKQITSSIIVLFIFYF